MLGSSLRDGSRLQKLGHDARSCLLLRCPSLSRLLTRLTYSLGGHTAELIAMLSALPPERYTPRTYLVSAGDTHSRGKAAALETRLGGSTPHVVTLPRARAVKQSFLSAPLSTAVALAGCMQVLVLPQLCAGRRRVGPDMLLMNGPGTCVPLVASVYVLRVSGRQTAASARRKARLEEHGAWTWAHSRLQREARRARI